MGGIFLIFLWLFVDQQFIQMGRQKSAHNEAIRMSIHGGSRHGSIAPSVKSQRLQPPPTPTTPMPVVGILKSAKSYTNLPPPPPPPPTHADHYKAYSSKRCESFFFRIINCLKAAFIVIFCLGNPPIRLVQEVIYFGGWLDGILDSYIVGIGTYGLQ